MHPINAGMLEELVYCKPYFDPHGLIVATRDEQVVGFVHAGFGPHDDAPATDTELGVTCMLMVHPQEATSRLTAELLAQSEEYQRLRGAKVLYAGGIHPLNPFYLGLYGGSELPGVLVTDTDRHDAYRDAGYEEIDRVLVLHRDLGSFRPVVDRRQLQLRRQMQFAETPDPPCACWWDAHTIGRKESTRYSIARSFEDGPLAMATFWNMEPLASSWGLRAAGLRDLAVEANHRRIGLATCLLGDTFRQLILQGVQLVEAQVMQGNLPARALYEKLGFIEVDQGVVLRKSA